MNAKNACAFRYSYCVIWTLIRSQSIVFAARAKSVEIYISIYGYKIHMVFFFINKYCKITF